MDPPVRTSRRSYPNLHNLSLAPLSSNFPLDASQPPSPSSPGNQAHTPVTSYIAPKTAPTTPGILSLSQSRSTSRNRGPSHRRRASKPHLYEDGYFPAAVTKHSREIGDMPKAKSTSTITGVSFADSTQSHSSKHHHARKSTTQTPLRSPSTAGPRYHTRESPTDAWIHRAGLLISSETRESKGQSWLIRRESSTSLVGTTNEYETHPSHDPRHIALLSGEHLPVSESNEFATFTPRMGGSSRAGSRIHSARNSRRGSRVGSRIDLLVPLSKTPRSRQSLDLTDDLPPPGGMDADGEIEPDFISDESSGDEEEIARLASERGFGLGGWMDRLIGWTLFSVDEDGEESDDDSSNAYDGDDDYSYTEGEFRPENMTKEELKFRREVEAKRRKMEREAIVAAAAVGGARDQKDAQDKSGSGNDSTTTTNEEQNAGGWQDAAWLFSVASKVIL